MAGRFGNAGQVDYSAANEAVAQVCRVRARSLHVDWTAWDDAGMAVRGGMRSLLTGRGVAKVKKVARTVADLEGRSRVEARDVELAVHLRLGVGRE